MSAAQGISRIRARRILAWTLAILLTGCAGQGGLSMHDRQLRQEFSRQAPGQARFDGGAFIADDGARLPMRAWLPAKGPVKAVVLALHGFNDYSNAFEGPGVTWEDSGIATYAYDQRGFGEAPGRGRWAGAWRLARDMAEASRLLKARYPDKPLYILGESMGAAVAIVGASGTAGAEKPAADGYILLAPAVWGRADMNVFERAALWMTYRLAPGWKLSGSSLRILASDNIEMLRALGRDPLVIKETRVDTISGLVDLMGLALASGPKFGEKALLLYGAHDEVIPEAPVRQFITSLPADGRGIRRIAFYPNGYHMLARDLEASLVVADMTSWMLHPKSPLPSGADADPPIVSAQNP
jgi:alpha-beta hydrolase superfamily lysophospholipase